HPSLSPSFTRAVPHPDLHSFPTRRSSDLLLDCSCALFDIRAQLLHRPILQARRAFSSRTAGSHVVLRVAHSSEHLPLGIHGCLRSEERRVGKEWSVRWSAGRAKNVSVVAP